MFFQFIFALLLGFSSPKQTNYNNNSSTAVTSYSTSNATSADGSGPGEHNTGGEGGQIEVPR